MCLLKSITGAHSLPVKKQQGTAALEFVLIAPVFFLVLLGSLSYAWAFYVQTTFHAAAENGVQAVLQMDRSAYDLSGNGSSFVTAAEARAKVEAQKSLHSVSPGMVAGASFTSTVNNSTITVSVSHSTDGLPYLVGINNITGSATASYW